MDHINCKICTLFYDIKKHSKIKKNNHQILECTMPDLFSWPERVGFDQGWRQQLDWSALVHQRHVYQLTIVISVKYIFPQSTLCSTCISKLLAYCQSFFVWVILWDLWLAQKYIFFLLHVLPRKIMKTKWSLENVLSVQMTMSLMKLKKQVWFLKLK